MVCGDCDAAQLDDIVEQMCVIQATLDACCGDVDTRQAQSLQAKLLGLQVQLLYCMASSGSASSVSITSVVPGVGPTNLGKAEDAPAVSGDTGVAILAVQTAAPASTAADGDYGWVKTDALGKLWTAQSQIEDTGHTTGDRGSFILGVRNDAAAVLTTTDLDYSPIAVDSAGRLQFAASGLTLGSIASITTSVTPGTAAANIGKAEDAPHTTGDVGVFALAVRNDAAAVLTTTDLDYSPIAVDSAGRLQIAAGTVTVGSIASITTAVTPGTAAANLGKAEDAPHTTGDVGVFALAVRNDAAAVLTNTDLDYSPIAVDSSGRIQLAAGTAAVGAITSITTSVTPGTAAANLGKAEDAVAASGDTGVAILAVQTATPASTAADGDYGWVKTDALGKLWTADSQVEDTGHTTGDRGSFVLGVRNDAAAVLTTTDLDYSPIAVDSAGRLQLAAGSATVGAIASITTSVTPGTAAANLGKAEDAVAASGDTGVVSLVKRLDTAAAQTDNTGDYTVPSANSFGALQVNLDSTFQATVNTGLLKLKSASPTAAEAGVIPLFVTNTDLGAGLVASTNMFCPPACAVNGAVFVIPGVGNGVVTNIRPEDGAFAAGNAVSVSGSQQQLTPTNDVGTDGDIAPIKSNTVGALYVEAANQVATYGATTTAGAAGAVTTSGVNVHTNAAKAKVVSVRNKLDVDVQISFDAGTTYPFYVAVGENLIEDLGTNGRWTASNIFAKAIGANSASGNIYVGTVI